MAPEAVDEPNASPEARRVTSVVKEAKRTQLKVEEKPGKRERVHGDLQGRQESSESAVKQGAKAARA